MTMKTRTKFRSAIVLTPFDRALKYLSIKNRSIKEIHDYLVKKGYEEKDIVLAIQKLIELKFLNDDNYARLYAESQQRKGKSKKSIEFQLKMKGVSKDIAYETLEDANSDLKTALLYITKRLHQFDRHDDDTRQKKIISRLRSRGYDWDTISTILKKLDNSSDL